MPSLSHLSRSLSLSLYHTHTHANPHPCYVSFSHSQPKSGQVGLGFLFRVDDLSTILAFSHFNLVDNFSKLIVFLAIFYQLFKIIDWIFKTIKANRFPKFCQFIGKIYYRLEFSIQTSCFESCNHF